MISRNGSAHHSPGDTRPSLITNRLRMGPPVPEDLPSLHRLYADPRVWTHFPSGKPTEAAQTAAMLERWRRSWVEHGVGPWMVRELGSDVLLGEIGLTFVDDNFWNLGYRFSPEAQGHGFAREAGEQALAHLRAREFHAASAGSDVKGARQAGPTRLPVVAYLVEHNQASRRLAEALGLELVWRGADTGNPDPTVMRLVLADRPLTPEQINAVTSR